MNKRFLGALCRLRHKDHGSCECGPSGRSIARPVAADRLGRVQRDVIIVAYARAVHAAPWIFSAAISLAPAPYRNDSAASVTIDQMPQAKMA